MQVVSLANNHAMDCGPRGIERTREACAAAGLAVVGAGSSLAVARTPARLECRGRRVVMLACGATQGDSATAVSAEIAPLEADLIRGDVTRWRREADILVVSDYWGSMYLDYPPSRVMALARALTEGGADVVLGHHPHVKLAFDRYYLERCSPWLDLVILARTVVAVFSSRGVY